MFIEKYAQFKDSINKGLKESFDKELKKALYQLWKHYKNFLDNPNQDQCRQELLANMQKVSLDSQAYRREADKLKV